MFNDECSILRNDAVVEIKLVVSAGVRGISFLWALAYKRVYVHLRRLSKREV